MPGNGRIPLTLVRAPSSATVPVSDGQVVLRPDTGAVEADTPEIMASSSAAPARRWNSWVMKAAMSKAES